MRKLVSLFLALALVFHVIRVQSQRLTEEEEFSEDLLLRPLPDGKVLAHFLFTNLLPPVKSHGHHHHRLFPKAIYQLVQKYHIQQMELSFTQGRWDYQRWGALDPITSANAKPIGVELWAVFDVPKDKVDATWRNLTHALSGLFCASINFLESPAIVATPGLQRGVSGYLRYGALPREAVCTENLTPWLKLLPCRDKAGLTTLLERPRIYNGHYHSLRIHLKSGEFNKNGPEGGTSLRQSLTLVLKPSKSAVVPERLKSLHSNWSLYLLFKKSLVGKCPLASSSQVHLELEGSLVKGLQNHATTEFLFISLWFDVADESQIVDKLNVVDNPGYLLMNALPNRILKEIPKSEWEEEQSVHVPCLLLDFEVQDYSKAYPLNVGLSWRAPIAWVPRQGPFRVTRFLTGSGNERGSIAIVLKANSESYLRSCSKFTPENKDAQVCALDEGASGIDVTIFEMVPWYVRLYFHTLKVVLDGQQVALRDVAKWMRVSPSEDRKSPAVLEMQLQVPYNTSVISLTVEFDKGYLRIDEHPPDANRGFDLPSALFTFPQLQTARSYGFVNTTANAVFDQPFFQTLLEEQLVQIYSENLLVHLATPDFSMPYNVITFTMTVLALYFGSLLNVLRRRLGEEERLQAKTTGSQHAGKLMTLISKYFGKRSDSKHNVQTRTPLLKLVLIISVAAGIAIYYILGL
ncbi:unnamed protein product [Sphagnum troendelagicum]|uniref:GPI transamidase component PIG-T n=1 Tax=Sphagnum troendelagicum TaxID=128251 RepID=A0ABP0TID1_9BRYO